MRNKSSFPSKVCACSLVKKTNKPTQAKGKKAPTKLNQKHNTEHRSKYEMKSEIPFSVQAQ